MSTIHTVVRSPRTFIRASSPAADASRVKHSTSSMIRSVKMVTFAQARLELAAKTSSGFTEKSTPATNAKKNKVFITKINIVEVNARKGWYYNNNSKA